MAVTSIWPINGNVSKVIDYARNPEKTQEKSLEKLAALHAIDGVVEYAANDMKTESRSYVTCIGCFREETAAEEFMEVKERYGKEGGRACYHGYMSFKPGEVDAETAHNIGVELAKRLWGDRFQIVIATHCNTNCYHNHFVINSVSDVDGLKFYNLHADYKAMRRESDKLCREYGLSVVDFPQGKGRNYAEYKAEKEHKPTLRSMIRKDIDNAIKGSMTTDNFYENLESLGYELKLYTQDGKWLCYPSLKPPGAKGFFRFHKLGRGYDLDTIERRVWRNGYPKHEYFNKEERVIQDYRRDNPPPFYRKHSSLYRLYIRYCYELHIIEKHPLAVPRVSQHLREVLIRLERIDAETRLMGKNNIETHEDLFNYQKSVKTKMGELAGMRKELHNYVRRLSRNGDIEEAEAAKEQIAAITKELGRLRKELGLCDDIVLRSAKTREELEWLLDEQERIMGKEETNDELLRRRGRTGREDDIGGR